MDSPLFCDHCRSLHPADGLNHFELLGLTPSFDLDPVFLRQRYLQLSRGVHPDHCRGEERAVSLRLSARLNEAYRVLDDPVLRAEYLLELTGGRPAREDRSVPPEVLAAALALREDIAEARASGDQAALEACRNRVRTSYARALARIAELARCLPGDEQVRRELRASLNAIKYTQKLLEEL